MGVIDGRVVQLPAQGGSSPSPHPNRGSVHFQCISTHEAGCVCSLAAEAAAVVVWVAGCCSDSRPPCDRHTLCIASLYIYIYSNELCVGAEA